MKLNNYIYLLEGCTPVSRYKLQKLIDQHAHTHTVEFGDVVKMDRHDPDETNEEDFREHQGVYFKYILKNTKLCESV